MVGGTEREREKKRERERRERERERERENGFYLPRFRIGDIVNKMK